MEQKKGLFKTILQHCTVWAVFILYELGIVYLNGLPFRNTLDYIVHYAINISLFYLNAEGVGYIYQRKINRLVAMPVFISVEIVIYLFMQHVAYVSLSSLYHFPPLTVDNLKLYYGKEIARAVYFIGFSIAYWFVIRSGKQVKVILELENSQLRQANQNAELENNLMQAKNAYLQSQLNPHLLFNTLSFIYNSVRKLSDTASQAVLLLSDMMRYSLSDTGVDGKVPLESEVDHIENMIRLNQLRFNEALNLETDFSGDFQNDTIIPLLLLSFIENIYKHGDLTDSEQPAKIVLTCEDHVLRLACTNKKARGKAVTGWGIGVENARVRLNMHYPDRYTLQIAEDERKYSSLLTIHL
ncbi:MAG: sensor histidine kinase [Mucilaginibacter sp.]